MICSSCGQSLVEVDNPMRREVRHRRGEEINCPAWREAAGLPADRFRCICDPDDLFEPPDPTPRVGARMPGTPARPQGTHAGWGP